MFKETFYLEVSYITSQYTVVDLSQQPNNLFSDW